MMKRSHAFGYRMTDRKLSRYSLSVVTAVMIVAAVLPAVVAGVTVAAGRADAVGSSGSVSAWGAGGLGQLGNNMTADSPTFVPVSNLPNASLNIAAGGNHSLAVKADRTVVAWGDNAAGQMGNGTVGGSSPTPVPVSSLASVSAGAAGFVHALAVTSDGAVWAWGGDSRGQLGDAPINTTHSTPMRVVTVTSAMTGVAGGSDFSLAVGGPSGNVW